jgi:hypothetical protein
VAKLTGKNDNEMHTKTGKPDDSDGEFLAFRSAKFISNLLKIPQVTANTWKRNRKLPPIARRLMEILLDGDLKHLSNQWHGWNVLRGVLISPENETFTPGEVRAGRLHRENAADHYDRVRQLRTELEELRKTLAVAREALEEAHREYEKLATAPPVRVQLVAVDSAGNQTALTLPVVPVVRVAASQLRHRENARLASAQAG